MELYTATFQLGQSLNKISGICPKTSVIRSNHYVTCLAGKSGQPLDLLPPWSRIFAAMWVRTGHYHGIPTIIGHHISESLDSFRKDVFHNLIS
jgi:hypothetical protein